MSDCDLDKRLDNISALTNEILMRAEKISNMLNHQNEELEKIDGMVDDVDTKIIVGNNTMDKIISDKNISFINGLSTGAVIGGFTIVGIVGFNSLPILGVSLVITGAVITGTIILNKIK